MSWDTIRFGDLYAEDSRNGLTKPSKVRGSGYKMINMGELFSNDRIFDIPMELVPLKENEKKNAKVEKGDLLFARQSLVLEGAGKCCIVMDVSPLTVFESHLIRVRLDNTKANPLFYYYYFKSPLSPMSTIVSQCAQAGIRGSDLQELDVSIPPLPVQNRIANVLEKYDELIENNQKQIKLLEEAAQRLYKDWFVDLHFPGYENCKIVDGVPEGWTVRSMENIADYLNGYAFKPSDWGEIGKPMFVCLNKVTCVRMYNYVQEYWKKEICALEEREKTLTQQESEELQKKINWMKQTEMCVVISQEQNEIKTFQKWGLDIKPHREKMEKRELDKEFKDPANPFRVVFVCAMWLTGFDVKCLSCLYLDKPMKAHTLMQTIARANRVAEGKENGLIIDYIGIVGALRKALAAYTANPSGRGGSDPTIDKEKLVQKIAEAITKGSALLKENNFDLENLIAAKNFNKMSLLLYAANAMCGDQKVKKTFTTYADEVRRLLKYLDRDDISDHLREEAEALIAILNQIYKKRAHVDNTDLMVEIDRIISEYISVEDVSGPNDLIPSKRFDISKIDFNLLSKEFEKARNQNLLLRDLDETVYDRIQKMMAVNPRRIDYLKRYQEIIDNYNQEQDKAAIEKTFMDLMNLAESMNTEQRRYVREGFENDEQLSIYDLLFRDDLSKEEIKAIKKVSVDLLSKIKKKIAELDHWTDKRETRAVIEIVIRNTLLMELPDYWEDERISEYRDRIYEYVYTHYPEVSVVA